MSSWTKLACVAAVLFASCTGLPESESISVPSTIIEVNQDAKGLYDITGRSLFFRLSSDGSADFEWFDRPNPGGIYETHEVSRTANTTISDSRLKEFLQVISDPDFARLSDRYTRQCCCTDASTNYEIRTWFDGKEKVIVLENYCDLGEVTSGESRHIRNIPASISTLFKLSEQARAKHMLEN